MATLCPETPSLQAASVETWGLATSMSDVGKVCSTPAQIRPLSPPLNCASPVAGAREHGAAEMIDSRKGAIAKGQA